MVPTDKAKETEKHLRELAAYWASAAESGASEVAFLVERAADQIMKVLESRGEDVVDEGQLDANAKQGTKQADALGGEQSSGGK